MKIQKHAFIYALFILSFFIFGCEKQAVETSNKPIEVSAQVIEAMPLVEEVAVPVEQIIEAAPVEQKNTDGATRVSGIIKFEGEVPKFKEIKMDADPICLSKHGAKVFPQALVLGEGMTMANVFVYISQGLPKKEYATVQEPAILDQKGCMYEPHVLGVMVGQPIKFLNPDGTLHNVHATPKINAEFNIAMPKFRTETIQTFTKAEFMFPIKCDVHPWMETWVAVMEHPFFMVTKKNGQYAMGDLPPGSYEISAWHEKLGIQKQSFTLSSGENKILNFTFAK